jgi:hypothetical protein
MTSDMSGDMNLDDDPQFLDYLIATGNADMIGSLCNCSACNMIRAGFARWKWDRALEQYEDEQRQNQNNQP